MPEILENSKDSNGFNHHVMDGNHISDNLVTDNVTVQFPYVKVQYLMFLLIEKYLLPLKVKFKQNLIK